MMIRVIEIERTLKDIDISLLIRHENGLKNTHLYILEALYGIFKY